MTTDGPRTMRCPGLLAQAMSRVREIVVFCRSGNCSLLAADTLQQLGYTRVASLATGLRGWNDAEQPLVSGDGASVDPDAAEALLVPRLRAEQRLPKRRAGRASPTGTRLSAHRDA